MIGFFQRWSDARYYRRQKRRRTEEIMGWVCVPVFLIVGFVGWNAVKEAQAERAQEKQVQTQPLMPASSVVSKK